MVKKALITFIKFISYYLFTLFILNYLNEASLIPKSKIHSYDGIPNDGADFTQFSLFSFDLIAEIDCLGSIC